MSIKRQLLQKLLMIRKIEDSAIRKQINLIVNIRHEIILRNIVFLKLNYCRSYISMKIGKFK